LNIRHSAIVDN